MVASFYVQAQKLVLSVYHLYLNPAGKIDIGSTTQVWQWQYQPQQIFMLDETFSTLSTILLFFILRRRSRGRGILSSPCLALRPCSVSGQYVFDFEAFVDFNWRQIISSVSGRYLGKRLLDCFYIAYTHPLGGVDLPFGGYDLWPKFWPLILRRLLTLIDGGW